MAAVPRGVEIIVPVADLDAALAFFIERLGFTLVSIAPADTPQVAVITDGTARLRLTARSTAPIPELVLLAEHPQGEALRHRPFVPAGLSVRWESPEPPVPTPVIAQEFTVAPTDAAWVTGRAGMQYRDLIPGRLGGSVVASQIRIPDGGPVPDYVHYHRVQFQAIFCIQGWVRVVYEDQGEPFLLEPGDGVLQPPGIRHRVLECSPGLEVVEVSYPAHHPTHADPHTELPTATINPQRVFSGQRFRRFRAADATWSRELRAGWLVADTGITEASGGLGGVRWLRAGGGSSAVVKHSGDLLFTFVRRGSVTLERTDAPPMRLNPGHGYTVPRNTPFRLSDPSSDLECLEASLPGNLEFLSG